MVTLQDFRACDLNLPTVFKFKKEAFYLLRSKKNRKKFRIFFPKAYVIDEIRKDIYSRILNFSRDVFLPVLIYTSFEVMPETKIKFHYSISLDVFADTRT